MRLHTTRGTMSEKPASLFFPKRSNGLTNLRQLEAFRNVDLPVRGEKGAVPAGDAEPDSLDHVLRLVTYQMLSGLKIQTLNCELFNKVNPGANWNLQFHKNALPLVFSVLSEEEPAALEVLPPAV